MMEAAKIKNHFNTLLCFLVIFYVSTSDAGFGGARKTMGRQMNLSLLAGNIGGPGSADGFGSAARFNNAWGVAADTSGNIYVAEYVNFTIRKISPTGMVTTLAGSPGLGGSTDGIGSAARFSAPRGIAVNSSGDIYVADAGNDTIRKITPGGTVTTIAGLAGASGSTDGTGSAARFNWPNGLAVDSSDNVYVADTTNHTIRKITPGGAVTTIAGLAGVSGSTNGTGSASRFNNPRGVAVDSSGFIYVADTSNHTIRKISPGGTTVTTIAGLAGSPGSTDGTGSAARFNGPMDLAVDISTNDIYVAADATIRKITPGGVVTTFAGQAGTLAHLDGTGSAARFSGLYGLTVDSSSNIYVADSYAIRKITTGALVTTIAGLPKISGNVDGTGASAKFDKPSGVSTDPFGNIYLTDSVQHTIRKVTPRGVVTTFAGGAGLPGTTNGTGTSARFNTPTSLAVDSSGNIYVADTNNHMIRKITSGGVVTTFAGNGLTGSTDGTGIAARFSYPTAVATDSSDNIYVADKLNHTIRKITPAGVVTTIAGAVGSIGTADGTGTAARFNNPAGIAVDSSGTIYVSDSNNHTIRKIIGGWTVSTLAGSPGSAGSADGVGIVARFSKPYGITVDPQGNIYVADSGNHTIRMITPGGIVTTPVGTAGVGGVTLKNMPASINSPSFIFYFKKLLYLPSENGLFIAPAL